MPDVQKALDLAKQVVSALEPEPSSQETITGLVLGVTYPQSNVSALFGGGADHNTPHVQLFNGTDVQEFTFFSPSPVSLSIGKKYTFVIQPRPAPSFDLLVSVTEMP